MGTVGRIPPSRGDKPRISLGLESAENPAANLKLEYRARPKKQEALNRGPLVELHSTRLFRVMTLIDLLRDKRTAIRERWLDATLTTYAEEASKFFGRERNRFANPVGHAYRESMGHILDNLVEGGEEETVCRHLDDVIRIRAIQDFSPSQAVVFVFLLKDAVRAEISEHLADPGMSAQLTEFEAKVDQIALFAFDIYTRCREQVCELRINEVKRSVAGLWERLGEKPSAGIG